MPEFFFALILIGVVAFAAWWIRPRWENPDIEGWFGLHFDRTVPIKDSGSTTEEAPFCVVRYEHDAKMIADFFREQYNYNIKIRRV